MKLSRFNLFQNFNFAPVRFLVATCICAFILFANAWPATAAMSSPSEGEANLKGIQSKTDQVAETQPRNLKEVQSEAQKGINAVQGSADSEKMNTPANSQDAKTVVDEAKEGIKGFWSN